MKYKFLACLFPALGLMACTAQPGVLSNSAESFTDNVRSFCGQAFTGKLVTTDSEDDAWHEAEIKMHVRDCSGDEIKIAMHFGEHRSMTWLLRKEDGALALRHDHRQKDGGPSPLTFYGGPVAALTDTRAEFSADQSSKELFDSLGIPDPKERTWAIEASPADNLFAYEKSRPNHYFRIEFDTANPIPSLPTPWGW